MVGKMLFDIIKSKTIFLRTVVLRIFTLIYINKNVEGLGKMYP